MAAGALFLSFSIAPTEEIIHISTSLSIWGIILLAIVSLMQMHIFVYAVEFHGQHSRPDHATVAGEFVRLTVVGYAMVLVISAYVAVDVRANRQTGFARMGARHRGPRVSRIDRRRRRQVDPLMSSPTPPRKIPPVEWIVGSISALIVLGTIVYLGFEDGPGHLGRPDAETAQVREVRAIGATFVVDVEVRNQSRAAAAEVADRRRGSVA